MRRREFIALSAARRQGRSRRALSSRLLAERTASALSAWPLVPQPPTKDLGKACRTSVIAKDTTLF